MRIYYLNEEYEPNKHRIQAVWIRGDKPEDDPKTSINIPYSVIELDEDFNIGWEKLARFALPQSPEMPPRFYVDNLAQIRRTADDSIVTINPNPNKELFKQSELANLTYEQLMTYIDNNVTTLATAKTFLKKLSAVTLYLVKHTRLDQ